MEPNYENKLETFEDLLDSDVVYGYHPAINFVQDALSYPEFVKFLDQKNLKEDCSDLRKCVERMITKKVIATIVVPVFANYVAREMGSVDVGKLICSLNEIFMSGAIPLLFKKGNPLLERFNTLMKRYLEAGLLEILWTELQHEASLRSVGRLGEAAGDMFFAFSVSHLMPAFVVLLVGTVLSLVVFIAELIVNCLCKGRRKRIHALGEGDICSSTSIIVHITDVH